MWDHPVHNPPPLQFASHRFARPSPLAATSLQVLSAGLPVSTSPTCQDECFFFISLVVGLPYSSIFCQFWLFFVFKLLLSFFWLHEEAQCVYLRLHLGQKPPNFPAIFNVRELSYWSTGVHLYVGGQSPSSNTLSLFDKMSMLQPRWRCRETHCASSHNHKKDNNNLKTKNNQN